MSTPATGGVLAQRKLARATQMLEGIVCGIVADGQLNDLELQMLRTWLTNNAEVARVWPGSTIARHIEDVMADGVVTDAERATLTKLLSDLMGADFAETGSASPSPSSAIPYHDDAQVAIAGAGLCLTGEFLYGTRADCTRLSERAGGICFGSPSKKVRYLIVGTHVSPDWLCQSYGRKIQSAMELRTQGHDIWVLPERRWFEAMSQI